MRRDPLLWVALATSLVHWACAGRSTSPVATASAEPRFRAIGDLVLADSNETRPTGTGRLPRYPADLKAAGVEAAFAAFFVVDTAGNVEYRTVSFSSPVARPFQMAVCAYLRDVRFTPVIRDGTPRRALVINPWTFGLDGGVWGKRHYDAEPLRRAILAEGLPNAVARFEAQPHC